MDNLKLLELKTELIPAEIQASSNIVNFKTELDGEKKRINKIPVNPNNPKFNASVTDPKTWSTFDVAVNNLNNGYGLAGLGITLTKKDNLVAIDIDHCVDPVTGEINPIAKKWIKFFDSYAEISPSGTGIRIFVKGSLAKLIGNKKSKFEIYSHDRFMTVTGHHVKGTSLTINRRQKEINKFHAVEIAKPKPKKEQTQQGLPTLTDEEKKERWRLALDSKQGDKIHFLFNGEWEKAGYSSQSEADLGFCSILAYWFNKDAKIIDEAFRNSKLMRDKWDRKTGNTTYGRMTIDEAIAGTDEVYRPPIFFNKNGRLLENKLADFLLNKTPTIYGQGSFHLYNDDSGFYAETEDVAIGHIIKKILGNRTTTVGVTNVTKLMMYSAYKSPNELRVDRNLINLANGVLNIRTGDLMAHSPNFNFLFGVPILFDKKAKCPRWLQFLKEIFNDDTDKIKTIQAFAGYILYPHIFIHKCLFLIGEGANGKSVLIYILSRLVGLENVAALELHQFSNNFLIGFLKDKLLNVSTEVQGGKKVEDAIFKKVISGDLIQADKKHKEPFAFYPIAKHIFSMNEIPLILDKTFAMKRRIITLNFNQKFTGENEIKKLDKELEKELPGILNWALDGLKELLETEEIPETEQMVKDKEGFFRFLNPITDFIEENYVFEKDAKVSRPELYTMYKAHAEDTGRKPLGRNKFYQQFEQDYPQIYTKMIGDKKHYCGIGERVPF